MLLLNESNVDITSEDLLKNNSLVMSFTEDMNLFEFKLKNSNTTFGKYKLLQKSVNQYELYFDVIKSGNVIAMIAHHESKEFIDSTALGIGISGFVKNFDIERDDFSDHMIYRASAANVPIFFGSLIVGTLLAFAVKTLLTAGNIYFSFAYLFIGCFALTLFFVGDYFLARAGNTRYKKFWKLVK